MDQLQPVTSATPAAMAATDNSLKDDHLNLPNGGTSASVFVQSFSTNSGALTAGFGKKSSGNFHQKGIKWSPNKGETTVSITFTLQGDVQSLSSSDENVTFSAVSNSQQTATIKDKSETIAFNVNFTNGSHDPQMVITPT